MRAAATRRAAGAAVSLGRSRSLAAPSEVPPGISPCHSLPPQVHVRPFLYAGATLAALGFGLSAIAADSPEADLHSEPQMESEPAPTPSDVTVAPDTSRPVGTPSVVREEEDAEERRRRWRARRNRYPAPTFTPNEWTPPEGPIRIGLQAGHWKAHEAPDELDGLRYGGTQWEGLMEWEVNLAVARHTGEMLESLGYEVDILPAVVPPDYHAHLFIAIHADGAADPAARGYRVAAPRRDYTGRAQQMVDLLRDAYGETTGLRRLPDATRRMRNYYAFNVRRYEHSLDPRTVALILETGFLTSPTDRRVIVDDPARVARGIVDAVTAFPVTALGAESGSAVAPITPPAQRDRTPRDQSVSTAPKPLAAAARGGF